MAHSAKFSTRRVPGSPDIFWKSAREEGVEPRTVVIIAVLSAIGFAATENVSYSFRVASDAAASEKNAAQGVATCGVKEAMLNDMGRAVSLISGHAALSGLLGCFLALSAHSQKFRNILFLVGLILSAGLHGLYDWLVGKHMMAAALTDGLAFVIFYPTVMTPATRRNLQGKPMNGLN